MNTQNPLNPLNWIKAAQDWFTRAERSSGFRAYLIYLILIFGMAICLLSGFSEMPYVTIVALAIIVVSVVAFIVLYFIKAFQDPNFCRSEKHVEHLQKMVLEQLGSDIEQFDAQVVELELERESVKDKRALTSSQREEGQRK